MGFDWQKIRMLKNCFSMRSLSFVDFKPEEIEVLSNHVPWRGSVESMEERFQFRPHFGWSGAIENSRLITELRSAVL